MDTLYPRLPHPAVADGSARRSASAYGAPAPDGCVVCGLRDERALASLKLTSGLRVVVCGSHDLIYRRSGHTAASVAELRAIARDRRDQMPRRESSEAGGDELGIRLAAAFARERRAGMDRRR